MNWKVVPLSKGQLLDVRPEDILENGLYRKCSTYRGGGGYDHYPNILEKFYGVKHSEQFIVQLFGCNLDCPYCYVTREGVWGTPVVKTSLQLVDAFKDSGQETFHLMGGAPALSIDKWSSIINELFLRTPEASFHSDLMLTEKLYSLDTLKYIAGFAKYAGSKLLFAINIKGLTHKDYEKNTRKKLRADLMFENWRCIQETDLPCYVTFTGADEDKIEEFWTWAKRNDIDDKKWRENSYNIPIIEYDAVKHVDDVPWGKQ